MLDWLLGTLAICAAALTAALVVFLMEARDTARQAGRTLDTLNQQLPELMAAVRRAADEGRLAAAAVRDAAEGLRHPNGSAAAGLASLLSSSGALGDTAALVGGVIKGVKAVAGLFHDGRDKAAAKHTSEETEP